MKRQYDELLSIGVFQFNLRRYTLEDNDDGTYTMTYVVPVTGSFELEVMLGTTAVKGSPFALTVSPSLTSAALSFAEGAGAPGAAGAATTFVIRPVDVHGGSQASSVADDFQLAISPGGNTFGSVDPSAAKRGAAAGGGYLVGRCSLNR